MSIHPLRSAFALAALSLAGLAAYSVDDAVLRTVAVAILAGIAVTILWTAERRGPSARTGHDIAAPRADAPTAAADHLLDAIEHPVLMIDGAVVRAANAAARQLFGDFIAGADVRTALRHPDIVDRLSRASPDDDAAFHVVGVARSTVPWRVTIATIDRGRRIVQLIDQSDATRLDRMRADFVANASHELRTPLASIRGFVETLEDDAAGADPAMRARFLNIIGREAARMQQLVDDLLSMSRVETMKGAPPTTPVVVDDLVHGVVGELRAAGDPRGGEILVDPIGPALSVAGDVAQLKQALHNVVGNAMKYGRAGTPIRVTAEARGDMLAIAVEDAGDGVAPQHLPRLTERFYRVDAARSRAVGGTGLGLSIVRHIVERHRGRLDIASTPGVGTTVTLFLPRIKAGYPS